MSTSRQLVDVLTREPAFSGRIVVARDATLDLSGYRDLPLRDGVQLVGERGDLASRPVITTGDLEAATFPPSYTLFRVTGNDVRVEGLHFRGPKLASQHPNTTEYVDAITVVENAEDKKGRNVLIADNEFELWAGAGVHLIGRHENVTLEEWRKPENSWWKPLTPNDAKLVRVERNHFHHNVMHNGGYGVNVSGGAFGWIEGNVFDTNRHAVAASGRAYQGYIARFNYILEGGYTQDGSWNQHFDVHGSNPTGDKGYGGPAGTYFEIAYNTIRGEQGYGVCAPVAGCNKTRPAFMLRGRPDSGAFFRDNVLVHDDQDSAISLKMAKSDTGLDEDTGDFNIKISGNEYDADYTRQIMAGEFDGDGRTDVFLATGTAWFYSRAGIREWELLRLSTKRKADLGLADIDNDGVTDVLYRDGEGKIGYVKGGRSGPVVPLTSAPVPMRDIRFGDFDGDKRTDMFFTLNKQWRIWYGRNKRWFDAESSVTPIGGLLFGEFDAVKGTDVLAVKDQGWSYSGAGEGKYTKLNGKLTDSFAGAVAADFNGNGRTDVAFGGGGQWTVSYDGSSKLRPLRKGASAPSLKDTAIGRFEGPTKRIGVVGFDGAGLYLSGWNGMGSGNAYSRRSIHKMR